MDELQQAQATLWRAVAKARAGEDRVLAQQVRERGEQFAQLLTGLVRMGHVHATTNHAFDQPCADLKKALDALLGLVGPVHLVAVDDQVYLNDVRLKVATEGPQRGLGPELARHNVGGLTFTASLTEDQVRQLVARLAQRPEPPHPRHAVREHLRTVGLDGVELEGLNRFRLSNDPVPEDGPAALVHELVEEVELAWEALAGRREPNILALRRLVARVQQVGPENEELWLAGPGAATASAWHSWRVAHVTMLVAGALGLPAGVVQDFGVAALTHDVGYALPDVTRAGHAMAGARALLKQVGYHDAKIRRLDAALHHHAPFSPRPPLVARVVRLAEDFDTMTRAGGLGLTPPEALAQLAAGAGREYDPVLTQVFINVLGQYPPGTYLALSDGRVVRTVSPVWSPELFATPMAVVVREANGAAPTTRVMVDLANEGPVQGPLRPRGR